MDSLSKIGENSLELKGRDPNSAQRTLNQHENKKTATGVRK